MRKDDTGDNREERQDAKRDRRGHTYFVSGETAAGLDTLGTAPKKSGLFFVGTDKDAHQHTANVSCVVTLKDGCLAVWDACLMRCGVIGANNAFNRSRNTG